MTPLDTSVLGLPLHPLVVHLVVVALPIGALATVAAVVVPAVRARYGLLALATLTLGALSAAVARASGEALSHSQGLPERHATFGTALMVAGLVTAAVGWLWWWLERRREQAPPGASGLAAMASGALAVTGAVAVTVLAVLTGHSGAESVWGGRTPIAHPAPPAASSAPADGPIAAASATPDANPDATEHAGHTHPAPTTSAAAGAPGTYTLAEVAQHATVESCWAAVDGGVYDLTRWINRHPGGPQRIMALCGTDASAQFRAQHGTDSHPNAHLAEFRIGELA